MTEQPEYYGIIYPERSELLSDELFSGYKIFLDHWQEITEYLKASYEQLSIRRSSRGLIIYGFQGCGKSILAKKISGDFTSTQKLLAAGKSIEYDDNNIWHKISSGTHVDKRRDNILRSTNATVVRFVENRGDWVNECESYSKGNEGRLSLIIADNCEKDYFIMGLLGISKEAYLSHGRTKAAVRNAAHRFVELCRTSLKNSFFVFFTNDDGFAVDFNDHVNEIHRDLIGIKDLKMPDNRQKEAIVRININKLNPFSYWRCIDQAGPTEKQGAHRAMSGAETFPAAFASIDTAIRNASKTRREGRPARKCNLVLVVMTDANDLSSFALDLPVRNEGSEIYAGKAISIFQYDRDWSKIFGDNPDRSLKMLSSEWNLRIILLGNNFVGSLLGANQISKETLDKCFVYHAPGTWETTKDGYLKEIQFLDVELQKKLYDNSSFWSKGSVRSHDYEAKLKILFPSYNTKQGGFLSARPDLVLADYAPCSLMANHSVAIEDINASIKREAFAVEFTAIKEFSNDLFIQYLKEKKINNYIDAVQDQ